MMVCGSGSELLSRKKSSRMSPAFRQNTLRVMRTLSSGTSSLSRPGNVQNTYSVLSLEANAFEVRHGSFGPSFWTPEMYWSFRTNHE